MGAAFLNRYVLLGVVGRGGVSEVYQAFDTIRGRQCAIKMVVGSGASTARARAALRREAVLTDRVRHPSVPHVHDYGETRTPDGVGLPFLVLDLLCGDVLADRLAAGAMGWPEAVELAAAVADVLAVAHRRGVVHRDLTAANVLVTRDGAKVIDFGLATTVPRPPDNGPYFLTPTTPPNDFPGPGEPADDVFALGLLLVLMLTGGEGLDPRALNRPPRHRRAPAPVLAVPGLPREVTRLCRDCLSDRPDDRPDAVTAALDLWSVVAAGPPPAQAGGGPASTRSVPGDHRPSVITRNR